MENTQITNNQQTNTGLVVSMTTNENVNLSGTVTCTQGSVSTQVMYMSCNLNADTFGLNINVTVTDKNAYKEHATDVRNKYAEFKKLVEKRATDLGYVLF